MQHGLTRMHHNQQPTPIRPPAYNIFKGCKRKKVYISQAKAQAAINSILRNGADSNPSKPLAPYKCDTCFAWHVGHGRIPAHEIQ